MGNIEVDLEEDLVLKKDLIPKASPQQIASIKSQISTETVNVNMRLYEIYSPNEQKVGEWQEMRDGVLKKKPVYEKRLSLSTTSTGMYSVSTGTNIDRYVDAKAMYNYRNGRYQPVPNPGGANIQYMDRFAALTAEDWTPISAYPNKNTVYIVQDMDGNSDFDITIQYTKTTDQWETVE